MPLTRRSGRTNITANYEVDESRSPCVLYVFIRKIR